MARVTHYAYYSDLYGTAELVNGSGYLFREEGQRTATLVSYKDPEMQHEVDMLVGGYAAVACSRQMEVA